MVRLVHEFAIRYVVLNYACTDKIDVPFVPIEKKFDGTDEFPYFCNDTARRMFGFTSIILWIMFMSLSPCSSNLSTSFFLTF